VKHISERQLKNYSLYTTFDECSNDTICQSQAGDLSKEEFSHQELQAAYFFKLILSKKYFIFAHSLFVLAGFQVYDLAYLGC
jgi:hypothetical protein